jgi:hypothetical protein
MALASKALRQAVSPLFLPVQSLIGLAGKVAAHSQPVAEADSVLKQIGQLPLEQRIGPLKALAAQVPKLLRDQADQVAGRITLAASDLTWQERGALQAAMRSPDNGLHSGFAETGFF